MPDFLSKQIFSGLNLTDEAIQLMENQLIDIQDMVLLRDYILRNIEGSERAAVISAREVRKALNDILSDPNRHAKMMFLYRVASSNGNPDSIFSAYKDAEIWAKKNGRIIFTTEDIEPYRSDLLKAFLAVVDYAKGGDEIADKVFVSMMEGFSKIPLFDLKNVLRGKIADEISRDPGNMRRVLFCRIVDSNPDTLKRITYQYFKDGHAGNICRDLVL